MFQYIVKRLLAGLLSVFILASITFFMMHALPGGPYSENADKKTPPAVLQKIRDKYGLNDPLYVQYANYMKSVAKGDFGISYTYANLSVNDMINKGFPVTAKLALAASVVSIIIGIALGIAAAIRKNKFIDWFSRTFATVGVSVPLFVIAAFLMYTFAIKYRLFPSIGFNSARHYVLPTISLALSPIAYITRMMRSSMLEIMQEDYIRTARAKGVGEFMIIAKHALRNALVPIVSYVGAMLASLLSGSFVVEKLFVIPGIGPSYISAISDRDYTVVIGLTIFFGIILTLCNIIFDLVLAVVDPRIKIYD